MMIQLCKHRGVVALGVLTCLLLLIRHNTTSVTVITLSITTPTPLHFYNDDDEDFDEDEAENISLPARCNRPLDDGWYCN